MINPSDKLRLLRQPARKTREAVRAADYMEQTLRLITEKAHHAHKRSINATSMNTTPSTGLRTATFIVPRSSICFSSHRPSHSRRAQHYQAFDRL